MNIKILLLILVIIILIIHNYLDYDNFNVWLLNRILVLRGILGSKL